MITQYNISVYGRVQGVAYRYSAQSKAIDLGIKGYARNMSDGSVFIEAQGTTEMLTIFIEWCRRGPSRARVENIEIEQVEVKKEFSGFDVR